MKRHEKERKEKKRKEKLEVKDRQNKYYFL